MEIVRASETPRSSIRFFRSYATAWSDNATGPLTSVYAPEAPARPELERFSFLDDDDRDLIALRRGALRSLKSAITSTAASEVIAWARMYQLLDLNVELWRRSKTLPSSRTVPGGE
ncbi:hypothetical protein OHB07_00235 [Streptomyces sp. NBC_00111]|uniref:hypothetical protein n=1 Tax=Streptomyces sp. NBC_00111 TaxID=2975655 RepID=UPI00324DD0A0